MRIGRKISDDELRQWLAMRQAGKSYKDIGAAFRRCPKTVDYHVERFARENGATVPPKNENMRRAGRKSGASIPRGEHDRERPCKNCGNVVWLGRFQWWCNPCRALLSSDALGAW